MGAVPPVLALAPALIAAVAITGTPAGERTAAVSAAGVDLGDVLQLGRRPDDRCQEIEPVNF